MHQTKMFQTFGQTWRHSSLRSTAGIRGQPLHFTPQGPLVHMKSRHCNELETLASQSELRFTIMSIHPTTDVPQGTRACIFGGNRGIGLAVTERLLSVGAEVCYLSRAPADDSRATGAQHLPVDLRSPKDTRRAFHDAIDTLGGLDLLVFGSASFDRGRLEHLDPQTWDSVVAVNLSAAFHIMQEAIPVLRNSTCPRIIVISSITGPVTGLPGMAHYGATKSALEGLVRGTAVELAPDGITVNAVQPGLILTDNMRESYGAERLEQMDSLVPGGTIGRPEDIAAAISYLASPAAGFVTGTTLCVDGGMTLTENPYAP
ncbi:SDR family NAD(P)-dependent oxidoreductase [Pseudoclavibacter sp. 13-3]|uniref:SDR family NAD(P)-dependent oxidoreductase n=1 Tax=Pseudoclavibacter sp. 13-3 TaxID=2901228 RepID=UPI001E62C21D|nr:SDR family oxidoreductase [Pseudoclavibacter sp. 13-3]MCD7101303.1 SDR family oxidoreductase [Pseudoclavibacter sp. 13-3]